MSALRDDDVGIALAGFDELLVHGFKDALVAFDDGFYGASALHYVALDNSDEAVIAIGIYEDA